MYPKEKQTNKPTPVLTAACYLLSHPPMIHLTPSATFHFPSAPPFFFLLSLCFALQVWCRNRCIAPNENNKCSQNKTTERNRKKHTHTHTQPHSRDCGGLEEEEEEAEAEDKGA